MAADDKIPDHALVVGGLNNARQVWHHPDPHRPLEPVCDRIHDDTSVYPKGRDVIERMNREECKACRNALDRGGDT